MAVKFTVNPQELVKQAENLQQLNEKFRTEVQAMTEKEEALSGMWEGDARNAFHNAYVTDAEKFNNFYNGISLFVKALNDAAQKYAKSENDATQIANQKG